MGKRLQTEAAVTCMKTLLMLFNFIFWVTGVAILAVGIWVKISLYRFMELSTDYYTQAPYILIGTGAVIVVVGSLGCCCTVKGSPFLLYMFAGFLLIVFVAEISAGISGFVYRKKLQTGFKDGLENILKHYMQTGFEEKSSSLDDLQKQLHCCGVETYADWFKTKFGSKDNSVPASCCAKANCIRTGLPPRNATGVYQEGCSAVVVKFMDNNFNIIGISAVCLAFFQLIGMLLAICLAKNINKAKYEQVA